MSITSEIVSGKRFPTVRRDGYDTGQVDQCLADLERGLNDGERRLAALEEANSRLQGQLLRAQDELWLVDAQRQQLVAEREASGAVDEVRASSQAAARLLEIAARDADALLETARAQAGELLTEAREEAEKVVDTAHQEATRRRADADRRTAEVEHRIAELTAIEESFRDALADLLTTHVEALEAPTLAETVAAVPDRAAPRP